MKKLVLQFFVLTTLFICPSFNIAQNNPGTLLKFTSDDYDVNAGKLIAIADIDSNHQEDVMILFLDTLMIIGKDSISYSRAFSPGLPARTYGNTLGYYSDQNGEQCIYMTGINDFPGPNEKIWSCFFPNNNSFIYGSLSDYFEWDFALDSDGNIWHAEIDSTTFYRKSIFKSESTFPFSQVITYLGAGDSSFSFNGGTSRNVMFASPDEKNISSFITSTNIFTTGNPGGGYHYYSTDNGFNWFGESIIRGSMLNPVWGQISNRNLAPYITPFSDYLGALDNNGVFHLTLYGIGKTIVAGDTLDAYSILYWNSRDKNWIAVSNPAAEGMYDGNGNLVSMYAPGFGAGQTLPSLSISKDGTIILIGWSSQEFLDEPGSELNIYPGDGGQHSIPVYYTDLLANISCDGGRTWSVENIFPLKNQQSVQEQFLALNNYLFYDPVSGRIKADYFYLIDEIPGASYWGYNSPSDSNALYYDSLVLYTTPVKEENVIVYDYSLSQNYPNPFNPNTKISYSIATLGSVTLKIYDILGREVATLINEEKPAGKYEVSFNASSLASGVYFYRLRAGSFVETRKMILIK